MRILGHGAHASGNSSCPHTSDDAARSQCEYHRSPGVLPMWLFPLGSVPVSAQVTAKSGRFRGDGTMPSPLTVLLIAIAGVFCLNGLTYVLSLAGQRKDPLKALFGILCLLGSGYALACMAGYRAVNVAACVYACRWETALLPSILAVLPWFVGLYSDFRPKRFLIALSAAYVTLGIADLVSDHGLLYTEISGLASSRDPVGGAACLVRRPGLAGGVPDRRDDLLTIGFCAWCGWRLLRRGDWSRGWRLLGGGGLRNRHFRQRHPPRRGLDSQHVSRGVRDLRVPRGHRCLAGRAPHARRGQLPNSLSRRERWDHCPRRPHKPGSRRQ